MKKYVLRYVSVLLAALVFVSFQFPFTQTAEAAGNTKSVYVITKISSSYKDYFGSGHDTTVYTYYKNGLIKTRKTEDGKELYKRDSNGIVTSYTAYNSRGKKESYKKNIIKDGKIVESRDYYYVKGKRKLGLIVKYTYDEAGRLIHEESSGDAGPTRSTDYDAYGHVLTQITTQGDSSALVTHKLQIDKHGNITKDVLKEKRTYSGDPKTYTEKATEISRFTYTRKGKIKKYVYYTKGSKDRTTVTCTYNKAGRLTKIVSISKNSDGTSERQEEKFTYKKLKVSKKYLKLLRSEQREEQQITEQHLG